MPVIMLTPSTSYHLRAICGADVGLGLMVGRQELDRTAEHLAAEIVDRHLRGLDLAEVQVGINPEKPSVIPIFQRSPAPCAWAMATARDGQRPTAAAMRASEQHLRFSYSNSSQNIPPKRRI
jgi:hypothetical protein